MKLICLKLLLDSFSKYNIQLRISAAYDLNFRIYFFLMMFGILILRISHMKSFYADSNINVYFL